MKKTILAVSSSLLISAALIGCGGSSSSNDDKKPSKPAEPVVTACSYNLKPALEVVQGTQPSKLATDLLKDPKAHAAYDKDKKAVMFTDIEQMGIKDVNLSKIGTYPVTFKVKGCDENFTSTIKVIAKEVTPPPAPSEAPSTDPLASPF